MNSAEDKPNQIMLNALPLDFVKYLEMVVEAVWDINPCPENLIRKTAINKKAIDDMGKSDIFAHAAHVGIVPVDNRDQLTKRLIKEFQKYASAYQKPLEDKKDGPEVSPEVLKILSEGR